MNPTTTRIAHLSDVHMLASRPSRARAGHSLSVRFLSLGRRLDAWRRTRKLAGALEAAKRSGAQHFVISGDLTEIGAPDEYEAFAETMQEANIDPDRVTLVPGNHDAYSDSGAWRAAMEGPLKPYASASAAGAGKVVERGDVCFVPVDVTCAQPITKSAGVLTDDTAVALERRFADTMLRGKTMVVVQHHPPFAHTMRAWQWIDGLQGSARLMAMLEKHGHVQVLHGHLHHAVDRTVNPAPSGASRVFGAPAVVDDEDGIARVRVYDVRDGRLESAGFATS